ncbi:MAG: hypothetical protein ABWZ66_01595 [Pyrinomonadaceae bacterium]
MRTDGKSTRLHERIKLKIPLQVQYFEDAGKVWTENTETELITICGLGFTLSRPVEPKRMIRLILPMPKKFRLFGFGKEQYDVWGIVSNLQLAASDRPDKIRLLIGTALTGAEPPPGFRENPKTLYDLKPFLRDKHFWEARELPRKTGRYMRSAEERRAVEIKILIEVVDEKGQIIESIQAKTLNISESGAAITAKLMTENPKYVLINTTQKLSLLALVRGVHPTGSADSLRLHLEYISGKWTF